MMSEVLFVLTVLFVNCESYSKPHKPVPGRNQRIIKVQGPPHFNHFHGHHKPIRGRPFGGRDEFIRPKHPPPIPPFFNGPSTNHIKHLPRPPPHVFHKSPSYGLGFPYKTYSSFSSFNTFRAPVTKDSFRIHSLPSVRPVIPSPVAGSISPQIIKGVSSGSGSSSISSSSSSSSSGSGSSPGSSSSSSSTTITTYHSPTFASPSFASPPVHHIISSDDNNGPIREIPAPNLAPKHHEEVFEGVAHLPEDTSDSFVNTFGKDNGPPHLTVELGNSFVSSYGKGTGVSHLSGSSENSFVNSYGKDTTIVNLDAIVKDPGIEPNTYLKESSGDLVFGKEPTVEIANFDEGSSLDVTNLIKNPPVTTDHHHHHHHQHHQNSGYEVTEHHSHLPSNDQIIKGHDGSKLYYAPDPDPSLPVHKVPPTNDPHSTPSNGQNINNGYISQIPQGFQYLPGGSIGGTVGSLSSQELFHLMHGYPTVISQPVVAFVGQSQSPEVILSSGGGGQNYYQQGSGSSIRHYSQQGHYNGNGVGQYLQHPELHNLLHNGHERDALGASHSSVVSHDNYPQQSIYSPQNQYAQSQSEYQTTNYKAGATSSDVSGSESYTTSEINHNYQYEPEASESEIRNSLTVVRQTNEGTLNSEIVKELLLQDSASNDLQDSTSESIPTILQLKNMPEVPFYASLPNEKAAEALATLQAAGSVASDYMNQIKAKRGDQEPGENHHGRRRNLGSDSSNLNLLKNHKNDGDIENGETIQLAREKTVLDIQKSLPIFETNISSKNLVEPEDEGNAEEETEFSSEDKEQEDLSNIDFREEQSNQTFGKRIRPK